MNFWLKKSWGKPNQWSCSSKKKFLTKSRLHELGLKVIMHKYIILNWVKTKVFSFIYVIDVQYYVNFRCQIAVYIYIHYKMITSLVSIYSIWNCYSIIDHIPCYINNCILMASTGGTINLLCLEGVPDRPGAPKDEAGVMRKFETYPSGWCHILKDPDFSVCSLEEPNARTPLRLQPWGWRHNI